MDKQENSPLPINSPVETMANSKDIQSAIDRLTEADLLRLEKFAIWRMRGLGRRALGRTHEDLLGEAISATLMGKRNWNKSKVDFVGYLLGAMQSISDNWNRRFKETEPILESEISSHYNSVNNNFEQVYYTLPAQEKELNMKEQEEIIKQYFEDDPLITLIICELKEGASLQDIRSKYSIKDNDYQAAIKRLRRKLSQLYRGESYV